MKKVLFTFIVLACYVCSFGQTTTEVPLLNNTYIHKTEGEASDAIRVNKNGLHIKKSASSKAMSYIYFVKGQSPVLSIKASGHGKVEISVENFSSNDKALNKTVKINSEELKDYKITSFKMEKDAYVRLSFRASSSNDDVKIKYITVNAEKKPIFLSEDFNTHFGLRGPSCHLSYDTKQYGSEFESAIIDVMVPEEYDQIGSYYMALGFSGGYFGFQNNSETHRQVLFSVWNSVDDDNPNNVNNEHRTKIIGTGEGVTARDFGHEGSGKQSFLSVDWKPGKSYRFLLHAEKVDPMMTDYSAWFYNSDEDKWLYMATLRRPDTKILITGLHSFLENFSPAQGDKTRKAFYYNLWVKPVGGAEWLPVSKARLTNDATGHSGIRLDFNGGVDEDRFYLTNGGYFDRSHEIDRSLRLKSSSRTKPTVDPKTFQKK